jgi:hypothetical protein
MIGEIVRRERRWTSADATPRATYELVAQGPVGDCLLLAVEEGRILVWGWSGSVMSVFCEEQLLCACDPPVPITPLRLSPKSTLRAADAGIVSLKSPHQIASLIDSGFGEETAQACDIVCLRQLSFPVALLQKVALGNIGSIRWRLFVSFLGRFGPSRVFRMSHLRTFFLLCWRDLCGRLSSRNGIASHRLLESGR